VRASLAQLPPRSGFSGRSFILVAGLADLPAEIREVNADRALARLPDRTDVCAPVPGAPDGGQPFMTFPE
jgi:hypothetical protein